MLDYYQNQCRRLAKQPHGNIRSGAPDRKKVLPAIEKSEDVVISAKTNDWMQPTGIFVGAGAGCVGDSVGAMSPASCALTSFSEVNVTGKIITNRMRKRNAIEPIMKSLRDVGYI